MHAQNDRDIARVAIELIQAYTALESLYREKPRSEHARERFAAIFSDTNRLVRCAREAIVLGDAEPLVKEMQDAGRRIVALSNELQADDYDHGTWPDDVRQLVQDQTGALAREYRPIFERITQTAA